MVCRCAGKEGNGGVKLHVVGVTKDVAYGSAGHSIHQGGTVAEAIAKDWVDKILPRLVDTRDCKTLRHRTRAQAFQLREHKPHPVGPLFPGGKLGPYLRKAGCLGVDETLQMVRVSHGNQRFALNAPIRESDKDGDD
jgi:hypothetical protein